MISDEINRFSAFVSTKVISQTGRREIELVKPSELIGKRESDDWGVRSWHSMKDQTKGAWSLQQVQTSVPGKIQRQTLKKQEFPNSVVLSGQNWVYLFPLSVSLFFVLCQKICSLALEHSKISFFQSGLYQRFHSTSRNIHMPTFKIWLEIGYLDDIGYISQGVLRFSGRKSWWVGKVVGAWRRKCQWGGKKQRLLVRK